MATQRSLKPQGGPGALLLLQPHAVWAALRPVSIILRLIYKWLEPSSQEYPLLIFCYCCNLSLIKGPKTSSLARCVCVFWPLFIGSSSLVCLWPHGPRRLTASVACVHVDAAEWRLFWRKLTPWRFGSPRPPPSNDHLPASSPYWLCVCVCGSGSVCRPTECVRSTAMILDKAMFQSSSVKALVTSPLVACRMWSSTTKNLFKRKAGKKNSNSTF